MRGLCCEPTRHNDALMASGTPSSVRLAGLDDHPIVLEGVALSLTHRAPWIEWCGSYSTGRDLVDSLRDPDNKPDLMLVDLHLGDGTDPYVAIEDLNGLDIRCIVFTSELRPVPIRRAVAAGARGIVLKSDPVDTLVNVIHDVAAGDFSASSELAFVLLTDESLVPHLSQRELQVLELLADGVPRKSIGKRLSPAISTATVVTYINRICARYRELGHEIGSLTDALRVATADGYLTPRTDPR